MPQPAPAIKKNDNVIVITGRDRGKRGRVLRVLPDKGRVIVEGVNFIKRHTRAESAEERQGRHRRARGVAAARRTCSSSARSAARRRASAAGCSTTAGACGSA